MKCKILILLLEMTKELSWNDTAARSVSQSTFSLNAIKHIQKKTYTSQNVIIQCKVLSYFLVNSAEKWYKINEI